MQNLHFELNSSVLFHQLLAWSYKTLNNNMYKWRLFKIRCHNHLFNFTINISSVFLDGNYVSRKIWILYEIMIKINLHKSLKPFQPFTIYTKILKSSKFHNIATELLRKEKDTRYPVKRRIIDPIPWYLTTIIIIPAALSTGKIPRDRNNGVGPLKISKPRFKTHPPRKNSAA